MWRAIVAIVIDNKKEMKEFLVTYFEIRSSLTETMLKDQLELVSACDKHLEENGRLVFLHVDARLRHGVEDAFGAINQALKVTAGPAGMKAEDKVTRGKAALSSLLEVLSCT